MRHILIVLILMSLKFKYIYTTQFSASAVIAYPLKHPRKRPNKYNFTVMLVATLFVLFKYHHRCDRDRFMV